MVSYSANYTACAETYSVKVSKSYMKIENWVEQGKYKKAQQHVLNLLKNNPNDMKARAYLGNIYSAQYKLDAAERELSRVLENNPDNAVAHNGLGMVHYRRTASSDMEIIKNKTKYYNKALNEFASAIKINPDLYQAYNNAGKVLFEAGRINDAEKYFRKALEIRPDYSEALENYGKVLFSKNMNVPAIAKYREAIKLNSKNSSAYYNLGEALIAKGEYSKAIKELQTSLYLFENSAPVHDMLGKAYEMQGNEAAAITEYKKSFLIKPEYTPPYLRLADIYNNRGDEEFSIAELRNSLAINPNFTEGKAKIADILLNIGKTEQAIDYYKELVDVPNYNTKALKGLSKAYFLKAQNANTHATMLSDYEFIEIEHLLKKAIAYNPDNIELYLALLRVSRISQKDNQSEFYLSRIIENPANSKINHIVKGEAYLTYKKYNSAENEFIHSLNSSESTEDLLQLAEIFIINRSYRVAKIALNRVLADQPDNLKAKRSLNRIRRNENQAFSKCKIAEAFYREGQKIAAIEAYRDSLSLNPYLAEAQLGIAKALEKNKYYYNAVEHYTAYVNIVDVSKDSEKYKKKIKKLNKKIAKIETKGKTIKKFTRL